MTSKEKDVEMFSTCPRSDMAVSGLAYLREVENVARWSEEAGCKGILVYSDNSMLDPWLVSERILQVTQALCPLVAVQPIYMHPYAAAKMVATLGFLHERKVYLNMVAGGFKNDLVALDDTTPHDRRYSRLEEYTSVILQLLRTSGPVTFEGEFYKVDKLTLKPALPSTLMPGIFLSGSSEAGMQSARALGAVAVQYPKPICECSAEPPPAGLECGIRVGIIARDDEEEAWNIAERRFPPDRKGEVTHQLAMKISDSKWHEQLSQTAESNRAQRNVYWLRPFETYKTFCPYLVGSYAQVSEELARYARLGFKTFILDIPPSQEELIHVGIAFGKIAELSGHRNGDGK
jgi:alkanesulfonate monooxygenase